MSEAWTLLRLLRWTTTFFAEKGIANPRLDAELLLAHCLNLDRVGLYLNYDRPLAAAELDTIRPLVKRRGQREPLQYLTGTTEFWSLQFSVTPAVLIPRPETEILVEEAVAHAAEAGRLLDVGTGSGVIVVSLATELPGWQLTGVDISTEALAVAAENVATHNLNERIELLEGSLAKLPPQRYDLIVSNPPYIALDEWDGLMPEVRCFEPQLALLAGDEGLIHYRQLAQQADSHLTDGGWLLVEIGYRQAGAVEALFRDAGLKNIFVRDDYARQPRVVGGQRI